MTLLGNEDLLAPFTGWQPSASSFHPISPTPYSSGALQQQLMLRMGQAHAPPLKVHLQRATVVDVGVESSCFTRVLSKSYMMSHKVVGQGAVHHATISRNSLTWAGTIILPSDAIAGGFLAHGLRVSVRPGPFCGGVQTADGARVDRIALLCPSQHQSRGSSRSASPSRCG